MRAVLTLTLLLLCALTTGIDGAIAQSQESLLILRPTCNSEPCAAFEPETPSTLQTEPLREGDILSMELVVLNPNELPIQRVRSWLNYDSVHLEGVTLSINENVFSLPTADESDFYPEDGFVKIESSAPEGLEPTEEEIVLATIDFRVIDSSAPAGTAINFYNVQPDGNTEIVGLSDLGEPVPLLDIIPPTLHIIFNTEPITEDEPTENTDVETPTSDPNPNSSSTDVLPSPTENKTTTTTIPESVFSLLQVQSLRLTTEGSAVYLAWDTLPSPSIKGYNIYYGSISGEYIQRRTVGSGFSSATIRALPMGTTYYFAIRAINQGDTESAFSQEVAIRVGDPNTSTSPLSLDTLVIEPSNPLTGSALDQLVLPENTLPTDTVTTVPGETGTGTFLFVLLAIAAIAGTFIALSRQIVITNSSQMRCVNVSTLTGLKQKADSQ